jgi:hypothetical protein
MQILSSEKLSLYKLDSNFANIKISENLTITDKTLRIKNGIKFLYLKEAPFK